ncbi:ribonuclease H, partial [Trifolium pratense]
RDSIGWGGTTTRDFTVQSAYVSQSARGQTIEGDWKALWGWKGPYRIQTFMWIAAHERLLTNYRRSKWGVGISPTCSECNRDNETTLHGLDLQEYQQPAKRNSKEEMDNYLFSGLLAHMDMRNKSIFEDDFQRPSNPTYTILKMVDDIDNCNHHSMNISHGNTVFIGWKKPQEGWVKLNCDGAYKDTLELAGCGGLLRDSNGRWLTGYSRKIGTCDALSAEMWGMYL